MGLARSELEAQSSASFITPNPASKQASMQDHDTNTDTWLVATAVWSWKKCPDLANPLFLDLDYCAARTTSSAIGGFGLK